MVSLDADLCGATQQYFDGFEANCKERNPEVECTCCTMCCNAEGEDCEATLPPSTDSPLGPNITAAEATERYTTRLWKKFDTHFWIGQDETTAQYTAAMCLAGSDRIGPCHIGFLQDLCPLVRPGWARSEDDGCIITFLGGGERCQFQGHNRISFEHKTNIKWNAN